MKWLEMFNALDVHEHYVVALGFAMVLAFRDYFMDDLESSVLLVNNTSNY
uniref:Uncharacterized protein n=1 Tax=Arundo donax TaxID=35708 RepID=A0A0A9C594_ARUDO